MPYKDKSKTQECCKRLYATRKAAGLCPTCGINSQQEHTIVCVDCEAKNRARQAQKEITGQCFRCSNPVLSGHKACEEHLELGRQEKAVSWQTMKSEIHEAYGGAVCVGCGKTDRRCLQVDHINNDGGQHRRRLAEEDPQLKFYHWLKRENFPSGFQILCANCNWIKQVNGGVLETSTDGLCYPPVSRVALSFDLTQLHDDTP